MSTTLVCPKCGSDNLWEIADETVYARGDAFLDADGTREFEQQRSDTEDSHTIRGGCSGCDWHSEGDWLAHLKVGEEIPAVPEIQEIPAPPMDSPSRLERLARLKAKRDEARKEQQ